MPSDHRRNNAVLPKHRVAVSDGVRQVGLPPGNEQGMHVELIRDEGVVRFVEIRCACGETVRLECEYTEAVSA